MYIIKCSVIYTKLEPKSKLVLSLNFETNYALAAKEVCIRAYKVVDRSWLKNMA